jgi:hypothetical protein
MYRWYQPEDPAIAGGNRIIGMSLNPAGTLAAVATLGRDGRYGQLTAFSPASAAPVLELSVPGDVRCFAAAGDRLAIGTWRDVGELALGGETIGIDLTQRLQDTPPLVREIRAAPRFSDPGATVGVTCRVESPPSLDKVTAEVEGPDEHVWTTIALADDGQHGDGSAGDGLFGGTWTTPDTPRDYVVDLLAADSDGQVARHPNAASFSTRPHAELAVESIILESGHSSLAPGTNRFALRIINRGQVPARDFVVTAASNDLHVSEISDEFENQIVIRNLEPGQAVTTPLDFRLDIAASLPVGHEVELQVEMEDANDLWSDVHRFPACSTSESKGKCPGSRRIVMSRGGK